MVQIKETTIFEEASKSRDQSSLTEAKILKDIMMLAEFQESLAMDAKNKLSWYEVFREHPNLRFDLNHIYTYGEHLDSRSSLSDDHTFDEYLNVLRIHHQLE